MREIFREKRFSDATLAVIWQAEAIIDELSDYTLTLRQLYYQFVGSGLLPNQTREYNRLGRILNDARLAGLIDWSSIEDRTRNVKRLPNWSSPASIIRGAANSYREDLWEMQQYRPEVWIEKEALVGVIERVCEEWRVPFFACRGYTSQSEVYAAGKRFEEADQDCHQPIVFHLGDHDPSGIDMTRDNAARLRMFAGFGVEVIRLALNFDQVEEHDPPPNPAKMTDSRFASYVTEYGPESWELDALDPPTIERIIGDAIEEIVDDEVWTTSLEDEAENRQRLERTSQHWSKVSRFVEDIE